MKLKPLRNNLIILQDPDTTKTQSGLIVKAAVSEGLPSGTVVAVGPGVTVKGKFVPTTTQVGDKVIYTPGAKVELKEDGVTYTVITEDELVATLVNE